MIAACLVKRSASRPRSRIIRALCPFTTPLETIFLLVPGRAAHYTQDPSDTQSFSAKNQYYRGFPLLRGHRQLATRRSQHSRCDWQTDGVRSEHDIGLLTIELPAIVLIRRKKLSSISRKSTTGGPGCKALSCRRPPTGTTPKSLREQQRKPAQEKHKFKVVRPDLP